MSHIHMPTHTHIQTETHAHTHTFKFQSLLNTFLNTTLHKKHMPGISINNRNNPCQDFFCTLMFLSMSYTALLCVFAPNVLNLFVQILQENWMPSVLSYHRLLFSWVLSAAPLEQTIVTWYLLFNNLANIPSCRVAGTGQYFFFF